MLLCLPLLALGQYWIPETSFWPPSHPATAAQAGLAVDIDGDWAVVSTPSAARLEMYRRTGGGWAFTQEILGPAGVSFGIDVDIQVRWMLVGASDGIGRLYFFDGMAWVLHDQLPAPVAKRVEMHWPKAALAGGTAGEPITIYNDGPSGFRLEWTIPDPNPGSGFGYALDIDSPDYLLVGAPWEETYPNRFNGAVYLYERGPSGWALLHRFTYPPDERLVGFQVALRDGVALIAIPDDMSHGDGRVSVRSIASGWAEEASLRAGFQAHDGLRFGSSLAFDGETMVAGSRDPLMPRRDRGSLHVFRREVGGWAYRGNFLASDAETNDYLGFGPALSVAGNEILAGAPGRSGIFGDEGGAYLFEIHDFGLAAQRLEAAVGETAEYFVFGGAPGSPVWLGCVERDGVPVQRLLRSVLLRQNGTFHFQLPVPPHLAGSTVLIQALGTSATSSARELTNTIRLTVP